MTDNGTRLDQSPPDAIIVDAGGPEQTLARPIGSEGRGATLTMFLPIGHIIVFLHLCVGALLRCGASSLSMLPIAFRLSFRSPLTRRCLSTGAAPQAAALRWATGHRVVHFGRRSAAQPMGGHPQPYLHSTGGRTSAHGPRRGWSLGSLARDGKS